MIKRISPETQKRVDLLFSEGDRDEVVKLLIEECGTNLPFLGNLDEVGLERFQFAALKLSNGEIPELKEAIKLAKLDWRDLLMAAGFGEDARAHIYWLPKQDSSTSA